MDMVHVILSLRRAGGSIRGRWFPSAGAIPFADRQERVPRHIDWYITSLLGGGIFGRIIRSARLIFQRINGVRILREEQCLPPALKRRRGEEILEAVARRGPAREKHAYRT